MNVQLLDCTLRDGGYVNDWRFGHSTAVCILERLAEAGLDVIEVGFLDERQPFDPERTIQPNTECYNKTLAGIDAKNSMLVAMIDYGTCGIENIQPCSESVLDGIRVIFKQPKMRQAVQFGKQLCDLGYKVFLQMVSITSYTDRDMLDFIDLVNELHPYAVSIVDTYGLMHKEEMLNYFHLLDHNLAAGIRVGYHAHNNFQLAYANSVELIKRRAKHDILVDGTVYGMGKSAGNAPLELLAMYLNENYGKSYDLNQILEVIDTNILRIYHQKYWGYNLLYFLSASNDCHPNYINHLLSKKTLSVKAINEIVQKLPADSRLNYNQSMIEQLYDEYQKKNIPTEHSMRALQMRLCGRKLLVLGPGKSIVSCADDIHRYIAENDPIIIATNFLPAEYNPEMIFVSNAKRYTVLVSDFLSCATLPDIIATSNITAVDTTFKYVLNYAELAEENHYIEDNALILLLKLLCKCQPDQVTLAGFDGFEPNVDDNYYDKYMNMSDDYARLSAVNAAIRDKLPQFMQTLDIVFLTPSLYIEEKA